MIEVAELQWLRLTSPALPVGAFSYSRGLEHAVHVGAVQDEESARDWILGVLEHSVSRLDAPVLARLHTAFSTSELERARYWNAWLLAARESGELEREERQMGLALARLLVDLGVEEARSWPAESTPAYTTMFALAAVVWGIAAERAVSGYLWAFCESQVSAAVRLVPLGQTTGQRILGAAALRIPACAARALTLADDEVGNLAPGLALGSALHETQYSRLFRS